MVLNYCVVWVSSQNNCAGSYSDVSYHSDLCGIYLRTPQAGVAGRAVNLSGLST